VHSAVHDAATNIGGPHQMAKKTKKYKIEKKAAKKAAKKMAKGFKTKDGNTSGDPPFST
jgi:hypothetical protein